MGGGGKGRGEGRCLNRDSKRQPLNAVTTWPRHSPVLSEGFHRIKWGRLIKTNRNCYESSLSCSYCYQTNFLTGDNTVVLYCIVLYCIVSHRIVSDRIVSDRIASYCIVSYRIVLHRIVSYCIVLYYSITFLPFFTCWQIRPVNYTHVPQCHHLPTLPPFLQYK